MTTTITYPDLCGILRDVVLGRISDLHLQADCPPVIRDHQRQIVCFEGQVGEEQPPVVPGQVLFRLALQLCRGTRFTRTLRDLEAYERYLRETYDMACLDLDGAMEAADEAVEPGFAAECEEFAFTPFNTDCSVRTFDRLEEREVVCRFRLHVYRCEPARDLGSGLCLSLRRIWAEIPNYDELGFSPAANRLVHDLVKGNIKQGLILIVGPTGSGKSTTQGAMLAAMAETLPILITTLEDPVEYRFPNRRAQFRQSAVGRDVPSYKAGALETLRRDPDVIVVGEIRDEEMAQEVMRLCKTGHLVYATFHGGSNTFAALLRFEQMLSKSLSGMHRQSLAVYLQAVIAQKILEPARPYTDDELNPPVLIQEVIRPQLNPALRKVFASQTLDPKSFYAVVGAENTQNISYEESFAQALERARLAGKISNLTAQKAHEFEEDVEYNQTFERLKGTTGTLKKD